MVLLSLGTAMMLVATRCGDQQPPSDTKVDCEANRGSWTSQSETRAYCAFPADDLAVVVHDDDEDGLIYNTEFHCEGLNQEGPPDGQEIECPGED
jgi:hypothetical protein